MNILTYYDVYHWQKKPNKSIISMTTTSLSNFSGVYYSGNNCERFNLTGTFRLEVVSEISEW